MSTLKRVLLFASFLLLVTAPAMAQSGSAWLRFVHVIPGASAVDVYTDGQLTATDLEYGSATNYIAVPAGAHTLRVTQANGDSTIWEQPIEPSEGAALTLVASSAADAAFQVYQDDLNPIDLGKARFTAVHAISDVPSVDVLLADGRPVIPNLELNQPYGTLDLPTGAYEMAVAPSGSGVADALIPAEAIKFNSGTSYILLAYGTEAAPATLLLSAPTRASDEAGYARIAHTLPGVAEVDVYVNDALVAPALGYGEATGYMALPVGDHTLAVRAVGSEDDLATSDLSVSADTYATALIGGNAEAPAVQVLEDAIDGIDEANSALTVINNTADTTVSATFVDDSALLGDVAAGASDSAALPADERGIIIVAGSDPLEELLPNGAYGGVYYTVVAVDGADGVEVIELPPASLAQGANSAPGAPVATPEPTPEPTAVPTEAAAPTEAVVEAQPTAAATEVVAGATPVPAGPTAQVLLNPGANLQLRQYPSSEALSLGLAPSGALLRVNGRTGEAVPTPGTTATPLPPEATPFIDPVTLLAEDADLDPALTWLNVTYDTEDGGTVTAWVNALYVGVRDAQGRLMRLRDLPTVPSNRAGGTQDTAMVSPTARQNITFVTVGNLDPGVQVHLRRLPSTGGESLALLPAGTETTLQGVNEERSWVFVRYTTDASTIDGWLNLEYVSMQRNGLAVSFDRLQELLELNVLGDDVRGGVVAGAQPTSGVAQDLRNVVVGTVIGLNPGANVHLRRFHDAQAESLGLLSNGMTVVVNGRSVDDLWYQVTYQGNTGWIAVDFLDLTFNGLSYERESLPIIDTSTPTPTPTLEATAAA